MKEGDSTEKLVESLVKELNCETVFTIPVFGGIAVDEGVVVTWIIMAVLTILSIVFVRNLSIEKPGKVQLMLESVIGWAQDFFEGIIGKENKGYIPYLMTVALYLAISNVIGLLADRMIYFFRICSCFCSKYKCFRYHCNCVINDYLVCKLCNTSASASTDQ